MVKNNHYRTRIRRWPLITFLSIFVGLAVVIGGVWMVRYYYYPNLLPFSSSQTAVTVTIPTGSSVSQIAGILHQNKLIRDSRVFTQYVRTQNVQDKLQAGTYSLRPSDSVQKITKILTGGDIQKNLFTILPGQRLDQIRSSMINAGFPAAQVDQAMNSALYKNHPILAYKQAEASLEGYLYPNSYHRIAETTPQQIIKQSLDEMQKQLTPAIRDAFVAQGLTAHQGVTLASVVEMEVSKPIDRPIVAQVFLSRLRLSKNLESDAITAYGDILAGHSPSTTFDTPYNVYIHPGLPIGPISNVSEDALQAVAHPAATNWLYFVSGDDGTTHFSSNLQDHQALTKQYCKKLCQ
ncbi:MAG: endolytic transglycosylase MltG [Candidatus Saccharibacteria bacterium]